MRNVLLVLALGTAAIVHFSNQFFSWPMGAGATYQAVEELYSPRSTSVAGPAVWVRQPAPEDDIPRISICATPAPRTMESLTASLPEQAFLCGENHSEPQRSPFQGL